MKEDSELILESEVKQNSWKIRPCMHYKEEYQDCRSIKARFQQYFVNGDILDCSVWQHDLNDCINFEAKKSDFRSAKRIIDNEDKRKQERMQAHNDNDVWRKRKNPPEDWNKPLPEHLARRYENSYLEQKSKEANNEMTENVTLKEPTYCCIM